MGVRGKRHSQHTTMRNISVWSQGANKGVLFGPNRVKSGGMRSRDPICPPPQAGGRIGRAPVCPPEAKDISLGGNAGQGVVHRAG